MEDELYPHFGKAPTFTVVEIEAKSINFIHIIKNKGEHFGGSIKPSEILIQNNIEALICLGAGPRALETLRSKKIEIYLTTKKVVKEALDSFQRKS